MFQSQFSLTGIKTTLALGMIGFFLALAPASATVVTGHLGISAGPGGGVTVDTGTIIFGNNLFSVGGSPPNTGYFTNPFDAGGANPYQGTILNLDNGVQITGSTFSLPNFLTFYNDVTTFELTYIAPGVNGSGDCGLPAAAGQKCTPILPMGLSPFNLANTPDGGSTASFSVSGLVHNGSDVSAFTGTFSNTFNNMTFQQVLLVLANEGQVSSTWSATFDVYAVPEPASMGLVGLTLAGIATYLRRRNA
ncbi:PEP-CTERM sorting domain-containing protein [Bryobacter aggregatus]|uniref:PEP-CTERM sorting domain-containing protein n=1 Tax=Bryobacter aggregatus TaxID=360054 RepID=UPI0004E119D1|nr:PEP-CTERM sorting domain-containing protein [Bryobacter aggregatus]